MEVFEWRSTEVRTKEYEGSGMREYWARGVLKT